jgi:hypothetical protein
MIYKPNSNIKDSTLLTEFNKLAQVLAQITVDNLKVLHVAPGKPRDGDVAICDGTDWNPLSDGIKRPIWFDGGSTSWKKFDV